MILAAHQPQYLAYTGYFDKMDQSDIFVLLDTVQYKKNEWINRNRIKTKDGPLYITVPVSFNFGDPIKDVIIPANNPWKKKHLKTLQTYYSKTDFFQSFLDILEEFYSGNYTRMGELNCKLVKAIAQKLGITTKIYIASDLPDMPEHPDRRLIALCKHFACQTYLAGSGGKDYMTRDEWSGSGINVAFHSFTEQPRRQLHGEFVPNLSIADLYMNEGDRSMNLLRDNRQNCLEW